MGTVQRSSWSIMLLGAAIMAAVAAGPVAVGFGADDAPKAKNKAPKAAAKKKQAKEPPDYSDDPNLYRPATNSPHRFEIHDMQRPLPPVVTPGKRLGDPPSDAIVLFDGSNLSSWIGIVNRKGEPPMQVEPGWQIIDGAMKVVPESGDLVSKQAFGSCQLHIEFATDPNSPGEGQHKSNSGVFLMSTYEIQVLDSVNNPTYADGTAASVYGQYPPLVNASRGPDQWQTYDIIFRRPHFAPDGSLKKPARVTILHNGVLVQDNVEIIGPTSHKVRTPYRKHADRMPLKLQDHKDDPIRFRNIWIRELGDD